MLKLVRYLVLCEVSPDYSSYNASSLLIQSIFFVDSEKKQRKTIFYLITIVFQGVISHLSLTMRLHYVQHAHICENLS